MQDSAQQRLIITTPLIVSSYKRQCDAISYNNTIPGIYTKVTNTFLSIFFWLNYTLYEIGECLLEHYFLIYAIIYVLGNKKRALYTKISKYSIWLALTPLKYIQFMIYHLNAMCKQKYYTICRCFKKIYKKSWRSKCIEGHAFTTDTSKKIIFVHTFSSSPCTLLKLFITLYIHFCGYII